MLKIKWCGVSLIRWKKNNKVKTALEYQINSEIYSICRCCWNVATYKWKVYNGKIEIISFVIKRFVLNQPSLSTLEVGNRLNALNHRFLFYQLIEVFMKWYLYIVIYRVIAFIFLFLPRNITKDLFIID